MSNITLTPQELVKRGKWIDYRDPIWGDSYNWSWNRSTNDVKFVTLHHSVTDHNATPDDIALMHMARGWGGIGYHFVITKDGTVYYVGDIGTARANVLNKNEQVIGICMIGDFTKHLPSDEQIISAHELCKFLLFDIDAYPYLKDWNQLVGHKDMQATACPGSSWPNDMRKRIIDSRPYTPVENTPVPPLPEPEPAPAPSSLVRDENTLIEVGGDFKIMKLLTIKELLTAWKRELEEIKNIPIGVRDILELKTTLKDVAGMIQAVGSDVIDLRNKGGVNCSVYTSKLKEITAIVHGRGWSRTKVNKIKKLLEEA